MKRWLRRTTIAVSLGAATGLSLASVWDTGSRIATIGGLVEDCCACLRRDDCLPAGTTEADCRSQYGPLKAHNREIEIGARDIGCVHGCDACVELRDRYQVEFVLESVRGAAGGGMTR